MLQCLRYGYNQWRDALKPTGIVEKLCKDIKIEAPDYRRTSVYLEGRTYYADFEVENEQGAYCLMLTNQ